MQIKGLSYNGIIEVAAVTNGDLVEDFRTYSLGGGEWSIEAHGANGFIREWVGSNGTQEPADDLWALVDAWSKRIARKAYTRKDYTAPDGTTGSYTFFKAEALRGRLHGLVVCF